MKKIIIFILLTLAILVNTGYSQDKLYRIFNSFSAGELGELLSAREHLSKYHSGCSLMENMFPLPQGGAQKRPGTVYVAESKNNTKIRLLPFEYSTEQSYILELGNRYVRFFTSNAAVMSDIGDEDISALNNIIAHWKLNDDLATTAVVDADEATHDGTASSNTNALRTIGKAGTGCFDLYGTDKVEITDHADFTFVEGVDGDFSLMAWVYVTDPGLGQAIISKWLSGSAREWRLRLTTTNKLSLNLYDETNNKEVTRISNNALSRGWHHVVATYEGEHGSWSGATAMNYAILYVDGAAVSSTATNNASYATMVDQARNVVIGAQYDAGPVLADYFQDRIDDVSVFNDVLSAAEVAAYYANTTSTTYEIETPYLTADLFELKYEQSADVLYITHPDYEPRKVSRYANSDWTVEPAEIENGPFRDQNITVAGTIAASATTGSVTLTASGCAPFVSGTTAGHLPSGYGTAVKSQTGALFKLVHPLDTLDFVAAFDAANEYDQYGTLYDGAEWTFITDGTWRGTVKIQRNYTIGAAWDASGWETVVPFKSGTADATGSERNVNTSGTHTGEPADYQTVYTVDWGGTLDAFISTDQTEHVGIVEITAVASTTSATAAVLTTLGSANATHKWSEGSWSNYRGWPRTVTFFEDRLTFGGNASQPDTIWASVTADYENMLEGADDDDALLFTLSSRQVNVIEWLIGKDKILIGTSGAEWTLSGSGDEPLTPSNVKAEQQSTYGSASLQATLANESVLFFQRGAEKMRELAYNWELDSYVAPDMTILIPEVTGDGITDTAFQKTPNPILWCIKENGDIAVFVYERKELITSWSRLITDDDFESVAVITGDPEDEVWVSVARVIGSNTKRYIEYFSDRDFGTDVTDAFYVDSGITDTGGSTTVSGLDHLDGETVIVLGDGAVQTEATSGDFTVSSGDITVVSGLTTVQAGLPYTVQLRTMPLSFPGAGMTILGRQKRINGVIAQYYDSGDFYVGRDATDKELVSIDGMDTNEQRETFPPGYDRTGYVFIYQQSPEPLTLLALMVEFMVY